MIYENPTMNLIIIGKGDCIKIELRKEIKIENK